LIAALAAKRASSTERGSNAKTLLQAAQEDVVPKARIRVEGSNRVSVALQCRQCRKAPCLDSCLTGALIRDNSSGTVLIQENNCIGCWTCTLFCPYGVIYPWPERKIALKCDRCIYMEVPVCVDVCPTRALELLDIDQYEEALCRKTGRLINDLHGEERQDFTLLLDLASQSNR
jgi:carbon-monoxide dehydrogenase iron sulfur subunit